MNFLGPDSGPKKGIPKIIENLNIPWTTLNVPDLFGSFSSKTLGIQTLSENLKIPDFSRLTKRCKFLVFWPGRLCTIPSPSPSCSLNRRSPPRRLSHPGTSAHHVADRWPRGGGPVAPRWRTGGRRCVFETVGTFPNGLLNGSADFLPSIHSPYKPQDAGHMLGCDRNAKSLATVDQFLT